MSIGDLVQLRMDYVYDVPFGSIGLITGEEEVIFDDEPSLATEVLFVVNFGGVYELCYGSDLGLIL